MCYGLPLVNVLLISEANTQNKAQLMIKKYPQKILPRTGWNTILSYVTPSCLNVLYLQESLGGNAQTLMLAAISPADYNYDETLGTLRSVTPLKRYSINIVLRTQ